MLASLWHGGIIRDVVGRNIVHVQAFDHLVLPSPRVFVYLLHILRQDYTFWHVPTHPLIKEWLSPWLHFGRLGLLSR